MSAGETRGEDEGGSLLGSVFAPLRLPDRVISLLEELAASTRELVPMHEELTQLREQTEPLDEHVVDLHHDLEPVGKRLEAVERSVEQMREEVHDMHAAVEAIQFDIQRVTGLRGERGLLERARDKVTGGDPDSREEDRTEDEPEDSRD